MKNEFEELADSIDEYIEKQNKYKQQCLNCRYSLVDYVKKDGELVKDNVIGCRHPKGKEYFKRDNKKMGCRYVK